MRHQTKATMREGDHNLEIQGFRTSYFKLVLVWICILMSGGLLWIAMNWKKRIYMYCSHTKCSLKDAERILLVDNYGQEYVETIITNGEKYKYRYFYFKKLKFQWDESGTEFVNVRGLTVKKCCDFHYFTKGLSTSEAEYNLQFYGKNSIDIKVKPVINLILREVISPFYIYQVFVVTVWFLQYYYQFGICIITLSIISVSSTVWETRKQSRLLRDAMKCETIVTVERNAKRIRIPSENVVPGDVMILSRSSTTIPCDAVLISGTCVVNESMLTGESIPITKVPVPEYDESDFDESSHKRSILSCGTELLLSRSTGDSAVKAIVYRTGFATAKGELVRAILYPKPVKIKLHTDLLKSVVIFFILGIPALIYTGIVSVRLEAHTWDIALFLLNTVTFFVPPALPAVLTSINEQAQRRLRKQGIYCLNTRYINVAGGLDVVCFDKTGTLTEENLDIFVIVPAINGKFAKACKEVKGSAKILETPFACCHSLSNINGQLTGHNLDIKVFDATGWQLQEPTNDDIVPFDFLPSRIVLPPNSENQQECTRAVALIREFPFESTFKRMSVVAKSEENEAFTVFMKGAPEMVASLSHKETVPCDMEEILQLYSSQGFRVIAYASKIFNKEVTFADVQKMRREEIEKDMTFLGLLVMENKLKKETVPALNILRKANIRLMMVTGDNLLTAITVSKSCGIIEENNSAIIVEADILPDIYLENDYKLQVTYKPAAPSKMSVDALIKKKFDNVYLPIELNETYNFAMDGITFNLLRVHDPELLEKIVIKSAVFARMSPEHKLYLIEILQNAGYQVGMCGDGANDCGALKTAHTGVSLSMAEASVAAPFTSTQQDVRCISTLIREGRATLVSTFDSFRYMVCYTFMFLVAILMLLWDGQRPSDGAYVIIDVILNLSPPFLFGATGAFSGLSKKKPNRSILSFIPIFSIISFMFFQICSHAISYQYCLSQPWYEPFNFNKTRAHFPESSFSGTTILTVNMMSYITAAIIFASGPPYRRGFFTNRLYVSVVIAQFFLVAYLFIQPPSFMLNYLNFRQAPRITYHLNLYAICLFCMTFCFIWEKWFVQSFLANHIIPALKSRRGPIRRYEKILQALNEEEFPLIKTNAARPKQMNARNSVDLARSNFKKDVKEKYRKNLPV